jgi:hypothetical protein
MQDITQIRNPKHEIRNNLKIKNSNVQNGYDEKHTEVRQQQNINSKLLNNKPAW